MFLCFKSTPACPLRSLPQHYFSSHLVFRKIQPKGKFRAKKLLPCPHFCSVFVGVSQLYIILEYVFVSVCVSVSVSVYLYVCGCICVCVKIFYLVPSFRLTPYRDEPSKHPPFRFRRGTNDLVLRVTGSS